MTTSSVRFRRHFDIGQRLRRDVVAAELSRLVGESYLQYYRISSAIISPEYIDEARYRHCPRSHDFGSRRRLSAPYYA